MAGLSAGITLGAKGHDVTIIERANHLRVNGSPIDIRGEPSRSPARWACSMRFAPAGWT